MTLTLLVTLIAGCGQSSDPAEDNSTAAPADESPEPSEDPDTEKLVIGYAAKSATNTSFMITNNGCEQAAKDLGVELIMLGPPKDQDVAGQLAVIEDLVNRNVDALVIAAADSSAAAEAVEPLYGLVNTSVLNVRSGAGTDYDRVGKLSGGTVVTVLAEAGDGWYQVSTDSLTGYVSGEYLTVVDAKTLEELSTKGLQLVELAMEYLGVPYRYGGASPSGFDCSGFVYYLCKSLGVSVPRTATSQWNGGYDKVSKSELQPGDLVFFSNYSGGSSIGHVGIYIGNNEFIHSSSPTSGGVIISGMAESYYDARYVGACRIF